MTATTLTAATWHHIAAVYDGTTMSVTIDGVQDANTLPKTGNIIPAGPERDMWIGHGDQPQDEIWSAEWEGLLDEVRISKVARDADWIAT